MKPGNKHLCLDVSTWVRGPTTAVGLCALRMCREVLPLATALGYAVEFFSRDRIGFDEKKIFFQLLGSDQEYRWAPFWRRWFARVKNQIFVSFDHRLLPVRGAKKIIVVHDAWTLRSNPWQSPEFQRSQKSKILSAIARADVIFCPSQKVADEVSVFDRKATARIHVLPWGSMVDGPCDSLSFESRTLVMVATLESRKNHELVFRLATRMGSKWRWIFVGADGFGASQSNYCVQELIDRGYQVQRLQKLSVTEVLEVYREAFAVICPSFEEGFGLTVLEGMVLGRPVWASKIATHQEVGRSAVNYFDPLGEDLEVVVDQLKDLARSKTKYEEQILRGFERAKDFHWRHTAQRFLELIG